MIDLAIKAFEILCQKNKESGRKESQCLLDNSDILINASYSGRKTVSNPHEIEFKIDGRWIDIYHDYSNYRLRNRVMMHDSSGTKIITQNDLWVNKIQEAAQKAILKRLLGS